METKTIKEMVDQYADIHSKIEVLKNEADQIKAYFEAKAQADLEDTKNKSIEYYGSSTNKIIVQNVDTVKPVAWSVLKKLLGTTFTDFVKEESKYTMSDPCKEFLSNMFQGNYIEDDISAVVSKLTDDPKKQKLLQRKLKGKYKADKSTLTKSAGLSEEEASDYAFMINEVMAYQTILQIMKASEFDGTIEDAVTNVKSAIIVDQKIKVTLECEK